MGHPLHLYLTLCCPLRRYTLPIRAIRRLSDCISASLRVLGHVKCPGLRVTSSKYISLCHLLLTPSRQCCMRVHLTVVACDRVQIYAFGACNRAWSYALACALLVTKLRDHRSGLHELSKQAAHSRGVDTCHFIAQYPLQIDWSRSVEVPMATMIYWCSMSLQQLNIPTQNGPAAGSHVHVSAIVHLRWD